MQGWCASPDSGLAAEIACVARQVQFLDWRDPSVWNQSFSIRRYPAVFDNRRQANEHRAATLRAGRVRRREVQDHDPGAVAKRGRGVAQVGSVHRQLAGRRHRGDVRGGACRPGCRVLDVAAGAGEQSLAAARRVGAGGHVLATDIAPALLAYAERDAQAAGLGSIVATQEIDGEALTSLPAASFDVAISRVYFSDQPRALAGMKHAVKPGGRVAAIVYSTPDRNAFFSIPVKIIRERAQLPAPLPGQPGPFSLGGDGVLEAAFAKAGFKDIVVRRVPSPVKLPSAAECVRFERESFGALHQMMSGLMSINVRRSGMTSRRHWPRSRRRTASSVRARCWSASGRREMSAGERRRRALRVIVSTTSSAGKDHDRRQSFAKFGAGANSGHRSRWFAGMAGREPAERRL